MKSSEHKLEYQKAYDERANMSFSELLRSARHLHHLTQEQLSDISTIPKRTIENWEYGKSEPPAYVQKLVLDMISRIEEAGQ